jgi:hypothetical protein
MKNEINKIFEDSNENNDDENLGQIPRNVSLPFLSFEEVSTAKEDNNKNNIPTFDLNKIFQFNFSYNFELLKSLLETMILNQREGQKELLKMKKDTDIKINQIENNIIDMKMKVSNPKVMEELKKKKEILEKESRKLNNQVIKEKSLQIIRPVKKQKEANSIFYLNNLKVSK